MLNSDLLSIIVKFLDDKNIRNLHLTSKEIHTNLINIKNHGYNDVMTLYKTYDVDLYEAIPYIRLQLETFEEYNLLPNDILRKRVVEIIVIDIKELAEIIKNNILNLKEIRFCLLTVKSVDDDIIETIKSYHGNLNILRVSLNVETDRIFNEDFKCFKSVGVLYVGTYNGKVNLKNFPSLWQIYLNDPNSTLDYNNVEEIIYSGDDVTELMLRSKSVRYIKTIESIAIHTTNITMDMIYLPDLSKELIESHNKITCDTEVLDFIYLTDTIYSKATKIDFIGCILYTELELTNKFPNIENMYFTGCSITGDIDLSTSNKIETLTFCATTIVNTVKMPSFIKLLDLINIKEFAFECDYVKVLIMENMENEYPPLNGIKEINKLVITIKKEQTFIINSNVHILCLKTSFIDDNIVELCKIAKFVNISLDDNIIKSAPYIEKIINLRSLIIYEPENMSDEMFDIIYELYNNKKCDYFKLIGR